MKKCIITGIVDIKGIYSGRKTHGSDGFYCLNGDIEKDTDGQEIYITSRQKENSSEFEDISMLVKNMPKEVQEYIENNKRYIEV